MSESLTNNLNACFLLHLLHSCVNIENVEKTVVSKNMYYLFVMNFVRELIVLKTFFLLNINFHFP